jgi:L-fuculose-phosphate aldolase
LQHAFRRFETLEFTAKTLIKARLLGGEARFLSDEQLAVEERRGALEEDFDAGAPSSDENEVRRKLSEFVRRAYRQRLFISTLGSFSARVDETSFVVTPFEVDRGQVDAADLVLVREGRFERGKSPSRAAAVHAAIYRRHPEIGAILNAAPVNATAFGVTGIALDTRTIPESYVVVREVARAAYGVQFGDGREMAETIGPKRPTAILENDGVLVTGRDVLEAFDRLEVLESTAEAIINCRPVGPLRPLGDQVTKELEAAFL